ncbi:MAG: cob(I)yrinic acid a,c-diamide adenosyltransferase [Bacteroidales bacterium]
MSEEYKIYTRGGDKGKTSLMGGTRVPKYDLRIEAYGTLDELNSFIGFLRDQLGQQHADTRALLLRIQQNIFVAEALMADEKGTISNSLPPIDDRDILALEQNIDLMNEQLPPLSAFIIPGGHPVVSACHICRTVCRRAERLTIKLAEHFPVDQRIVKYLNRLSDWFFVVSRKMAHDFKVKEILWNPVKGTKTDG